MRSIQLRAYCQSSKDLKRNLTLDFFAYTLGRVFENREALYSFEPSRQIEEQEDVPNQLRGLLNVLSFELLYCAQQFAPNQ